MLLGVCLPLQDSQHSFEDESLPGREQVEANEMGSNTEDPSTSYDFDTFEQFSNDNYGSFNMPPHPQPPLYSGSKLSMFQALSILLSWFSLHPGISKSALDHLLKILHLFILPTDNELPTNYNDARKMFSDYPTPVQNYDCCVNDCVIFRDSRSHQYSQLKECPECKEPRFKSGTSIPRKRFKYLPLEPRIRRLFANEVTSGLLQNHQNDLPQQPTFMCDIHDSPAWSEWYGENGCYKEDPRAITFSICLDGLNPFKKENSSYSMCPILLSPLNFPPHIRKLSGAFFLAGIIPGPNEPRNTDPYLEIVVDEVLSLCNSDVYDGYRKEIFKLQVNIKLHTLDYPGQNKVFHCQGTNSFT